MLHPGASAENFSLIFKWLSKYHVLSKELQTELRDRVCIVELKKGEFLAKQNEYSNFTYFLVEGIVVGYRLNGAEKLTTLISVNGDFISSISGMYGAVPAEDNLIAADNCYLIALKSEDLLLFFDTFPEMNIIMRKIFEEHCKKAHKRAVVIRMGSAYEKYQYYVENFSRHPDSVPDEFVASFLAIKPATLNKIKKERSGDSNSQDLLKVVSPLEKLMKQRKLYRQKRITLKDVAKHIDISAHNLSYLLNNHYKKSFPDFINTFRINFVKKQLKRKSSLKLLTIEALGDNAGFSSKSTFFAAFRKHTGLSPLAYSKAWIDADENRTIKILNENLLHKKTVSKLLKRRLPAQSVFN